MTGSNFAPVKFQSMRRHKMLRIKKRITQLVAVFLLLTGIILFFNKTIKNYLIKETTNHYVISKFNSDELKENENIEGDFDYDAVEPIKTSEVIRSQINGKSEKLPVIASIAIPSVSICLPIFNGLSNEGLYYGAGTMTPNQVMGEGNYSLASHRSDNPDLLFTPLERMTTREKIYITDLINVYTYESTFVEKVTPGQTDVIEPIEGENIVTLVTCGDLYAKTRLVVQGKLINKVPIKAANKEAAEAFQLSKNTY